VHGALTIKVTGVARDSDPLTPVIVSEKVPVAVAPFVTTVSVALPLVLIALKLAVAPLGRPATVRFTAPVNPPVRVTVTV
jgi:hypothetical protein